MPASAKFFAHGKAFDLAVAVVCEIDEKGLPQNVHVLQPNLRDFDEEAVKAVQQFRFKPAMQNSVPVKVALTVAVNFHYVP